MVYFFLRMRANFSRLTLGQGTIGNGSMMTSHVHVGSFIPGSLRHPTKNDSSPHIDESPLVPGNDA